MHKDIFDRIMEFGLFAPFRPFYTKNKEVLLYLFFGGLTFVVSMVSFAAGEYVLGMEPLVANVFSWVLAVSFAYITNRIWVFSAKSHTVRGVCREVVSFFAGRLATLGMEEILLAIGIEMLGFNSIAVKAFAQVAVIVSNYFISKFLVFKR